MTTRGLTVTSFEPTATGFKVTFNKPFVPENLALYGSGLRTVKDVRQHTGAGDGCTACHRTIRQYLEQHCTAEAQSASSAVPI